MLRSIVAIVSGGTSGLGAATALGIVRRGGRVIVADLPSTHDNFLRLAAVSCAEVHGVENVAEGLACDSNTLVRKSKVDMVKGPLMVFAETDVRNEQNIKDALDLGEEQFGEPVNTVINCAGICPARKTISHTASSADGGGPMSDFRNALEVNTLGTFNLSRLAAERMLKRSVDADGLRGCIINTASIAAFEGQEGEFTVYIINCLDIVMIVILNLYTYHRIGLSRTSGICC